jgi:hypothetical protein
MRCLSWCTWDLLHALSSCFTLSKFPGPLRQLAGLFRVRPSLQVGAPEPAYVCTGFSHMCLGKVGCNPLSFGGVICADPVLPRPSPHPPRINALRHRPHGQGRATPSSRPLPQTCPRSTVTTIHLSMPQARAIALKSWRIWRKAGEDDDPDNLVARS